MKRLSVCYRQGGKGTVMNSTRSPASLSMIALPVVNPRGGDYINRSHRLQLGSC